MAGAQPRPFLAKSARPTAQSLAAVLGGTARCFDDLVAATSSFAHEWNHSKASGWMLKVHDGQKALFYLVPLDGSFQITMTVRAAEHAALLDDARVAPVHAQLRVAKKYAEGHALQFVIGDRATFRAFATFLDRVVALRRAA